MNNNEFVMNNSLLILQSFRKQNYYLGKIKMGQMGRGPDVTHACHKLCAYPVA